MLGVGGTATVYAARAGDRCAAIKIMHAALGRSWMRRFQREARLLRRVRHDGLPEVYDFGEVDGVPYLIVELFRGQTLEALARSRTEPLAVDVVVQFACATLDVLDVVHEQGVVHRDLKPSNLFVTDEGSLKVLDFGLACGPEPSTDASDPRTLGVLGTPAYMAPEQARGRWDLVDRCTDVWALGAVMFSLLTGRHVHRADTPNEQLALAMSCSAPPIRSFRPDLEPALANVVDRALAYDRDARFSSARALRAALLDPQKAPQVGRHALELTNADPPDLSTSWTRSSERVRVGPARSLGPWILALAVTGSLWSSDTRSGVPTAAGSLVGAPPNHYPVSEQSTVVKRRTMWLARPRPLVRADGRASPVTRKPLSRNSLAPARQTEVVPMPDAALVPAEVPAPPTEVLDRRLPETRGGEPSVLRPEPNPLERRF